jgi:putative membrane protein
VLIEIIKKNKTMKYAIKRSILLIAFPVLLLVIFACEPKRDGDNKDSKEVAEDRNDDKFDERASEKNAQFVVDAVASSLDEIRYAELAEKRATNKEVKEIATMLKTQHKSLVNELKSYASKNVISIPDEQTNKADDKIEDLRNEENFDQKWCEEMKDMHEKDIKEFEDASTSLSDAELKNLVSNALPTLRTHYDRITACNDKLRQ